MRLPLIICLSIFIYTSSIFSGIPSECEQQKCLAIIDVGSTGSRLHLYSYDLDTTNSPINITERISKKIKPGFATIEPNEATINSYLTILFSDVPSFKFPVCFYATAGMRLLPQAKQQQFYSLVDRWFQSSSRWQLLSAKTISGNDEGLYGWLAANYQLQNLSSDKPKSIGYMDMGGASVEVAFPVNDLKETDANDIKDITLYGHHFKVFVHSFLGLGQTEVTHQFLDSNSCFIKNYGMPNGKLAQGNAYTCKDEVSTLITNVHDVNKIIQPILNANPISNWYTVGGLAELAKTQPFNFCNSQFTSQELLDQGNSLVCNQEWQDLSSRYPSNDYLYGYCLFPAYYYALIVDGYGIQPDQLINYLPPTQSADWTLGVVLQQKSN